MISLGLGGCRCGFWDAVDVMRITMIVPHGLFGVGWFFPLVWVLLGCECVIDMLGIGFRGKCFMNTCLCSDWDVGFFFVSLLALCLGGFLGVLDQGADSTLRDSDVQVLLLVFSFSFWDWVFRTNMHLLHSVWKEPLHCHKVEKRFRTLFSLCMQSAWYVKMEFEHTHT